LHQTTTVTIIIVSSCNPTDDLVFDDENICIDSMFLNDSKIIQDSLNNPENSSTLTATNTP